MTTETCTRYGEMYLLDHDSVVSKSLELYGEWAQNELSFLSTLIPPGVTVLDVGAFIGTHTLAFSSFVGPNGHVISFEPRLETFDLLRKNVEINKKNNITLHQCGVGREKNSISLQRLTVESPPNLASLTLKEETSADPGSQYTVEISTLDSYRPREVHLIKIDVEGMEREVLDGASTTVTENRPFIYAECNSISAGLKLLEWSQLHDYECLGHISEAFNPDNFRNEKLNIFGLAKEFSLFLVPKEKINGLNLECTPPIDNADDIAALILHKPQYPHEVLKNANRSHGLGILYPSPSEELKSEELKRALNHLQIMEIDLKLKSDQLNDATGQAQELKNTLTEMTGKLQAADSHASFLQHNTFRLIERAAGLLEQRTAATLELSRTLGEVDRLKKETGELIEAHQKESRELIEALHVAGSEINSLKLSRSWKFSAPLRRGGRLLRVLRAKLLD